MGYTLVVNQALSVQKDSVTIKGFNHITAVRSLSKYDVMQLLYPGSERVGSRFWDPRTRSLIAQVLYASRTPFGICVVFGRYTPFVFHFVPR